MSWSPDQEVIVFATGLHKLILMNKDFDPIVETALHTTEAGEGNIRVQLLCTMYIQKLPSSCNPNRIHYSQTSQCRVG